MKFSDGEWLMQPGVSAFYPAEAHTVTELDGKLVIDAPTRNIKHRGDTLGGPLITVTLSSPMPNVVKVRLEHYAGVIDNDPQIPVQPQPAHKVVIENGAEEAVLRTGDLSVHVKKPGWEVTFKGAGQYLTRTAWRGMAYAQVNGQPQMHERLQLGVGENVYGLGERFTAFVKNGQTVQNDNKDGGTGSDQAYKCVPFYLTNRGYGVLVNETGPVSFEVASERTARVQFSLPGESLEYFLIFGPTPKDILRNLTQLTGRPALPPTWSFGLWLTTSFTTSYDEKTCMSFVEGMKSRDLPLHVFHFDCFWMREFDWCNFEWDPRTFPDPVGMLKRFHERGLKVCVWINSYIGQRSKLFEEGKKGGYFIKKTDGSVWQTDLWQPGMAIVDFTNPAACAWFASKLEALMDMGVDSFKTDFGERIPVEGVKYHDGSDPVGMHNLYSVLYNECVFKVLEKKRGKGEATLFARSAYASGQRFPLHWGGDCWSTFEAMAESLRGGLSLCLSGFGFWSHDIGGFEGTGPAAVYKRWVAFGLLSSHSRLHGSSTYRVPWNYDDEACDVVRFFTKLKCSLMPYLYGQATLAHREGLPVMRAMLLEFPEDPASDTLDRQYMLGDSLLVAPVFTDDGSVSYYLPAGRWTHLLTGEVQEGSRWHQAQHGYLSLPLFVRPNTILPVGVDNTRPDYDYTVGTTFRVYELADGATISRTVPNQKGEDAVTLTVSRKGAKIEATLKGAAKDVAIQFVGVKTLTGVTGGTATADAAGAIVCLTGTTLSASL
jgi:alpha-D-xyloside xylohydrolase